MVRRPQKKARIKNASAKEGGMKTPLDWSCSPQASFLAPQVDMDDVKVAQDAALANVMSAVESALASAPAKRASEPAQPSMPSSKRRKASNHMLDLDGDLSSDSDEDPELEPEAATTADNADSSKQRPADGGSAKDSTVAASVPASGSSGSEQEALVRSLHPCTVVQVRICALPGPCTSLPLYGH